MSCRQITHQAAALFQPTWTSVSRFGSYFWKEPAPFTPEVSRRGGMDIVVCCAVPSRGDDVSRPNLAALEHSVNWSTARTAGNFFFDAVMHPE